MPEASPNSIEQQPVGRTRVLRLSFIIGALIGVFLTLVAVITFTRVYNVSVTSLNAVSHSLVVSLANTAANRIGTQINGTTTAFEQFQYIVASDAHPSLRWTLPSDYAAEASNSGANETWHDQWFEIISSAMQPMLGAMGSFVMRHADGSMMTATRRPFDFPTFLYGVRSNINATADNVFDEKRVAILPNGTLVDPGTALAQDPFFIAPATLFQTRVGGAWWNSAALIASQLNYGLDQLNSLNATQGKPAITYSGTGLWYNGAGEAGRSTPAAPTLPRGVFQNVSFTYRVATDGSIIPNVLQLISMPLFNASRQLIGVVTAGMPLLDLVKPILFDVASQQSGMEVFAVDGFGYLLAATVGTFYQIVDLPADLSTVPRYCSYLNAALGVMGCRAYAPGYAAQTALGAAGLSFLLSSTVATGLVKASDGARYYIASTPLHSSFADFAMHIVVTVPQTAIIGKVAHETSANIGIVVGCVVAAFVISFGIVWILMEPLRTLARRMQMAAALEDNDVAGGLGLTKEVADIQAAYYQMNQELQRLKGFVPQSVLVQNVHRRRILLIKEHLRMADTEAAPWYSCWGCCHDAWAEAEAEYNTINTYSSESQEEEEEEVNQAAKKRHQSGTALHAESSHDAHSSRISNTASVASSLTGSRRQPQIRVSRDANPNGTGASAHGQIAAGVTTVRLVSVAAMNVVGFHAAALRDGAMRLGNIAEALTALVAAAATEERGVVDSFHGDHFLLTFNAASSCATHAIRSAKCALRIGQRAAATFGELGVRVSGGVSSGPTRCGTLGSKDSRRFSIVGAAVPQAHALEQLMRRHPRDALWRRPASGPYRIAVAPSLLEELRTLLVYECVDVAPLPVASTTARVTGGSGVPLNGSRVVRGSAPPPPGALTAMCVVSQLLGEAATDGGEDEEWMYAVGDGDAGNGEHTTARVQRRLNAADAAAIREARALLRGGAAVDVVVAEDDDDLLKSNGTPLTTGRAPGTGTGCVKSGDAYLPLAESNSVYMLLSDVARMRERGAPIPAAFLPQQLCASVYSEVLGNDGNGPVGDTPLGAGIKKKSISQPQQQQQLGAALEAKIAEIELALKRWEGNTHVATTASVIRQLVSTVVLGVNAGIL